MAWDLRICRLTEPSDANYQTVIASVSHEYDISNLQELEYTVDTNNWRMEPVRE